MENTKRLMHLSWKTILIPCAVTLLLFSGIFSQRHALPFSPEVLTRDPLTLAGLPLYYGFFSNLGVMLWASAAAVNFLGAAVLPGDRRKFLFMIVSGILLGCLALDDVYQFHDSVFPRLFNMREYITFSVYSLVLIAYLYYFRHVIFSSSNYLLLAAALLALGSSMLIDVVLDYVLVYAPRALIFIEDGPKILGIVLLFIYYFDTVKKYISERVHTVPANSI